MGLNIKSERVHDLAREAARVTGKSQAGAIEEALEALLRSHGADPNEVRLARTLHAVHNISADYVADPGIEAPFIQQVEDLYAAAHREFQVDALMPCCR